MADLENSVFPLIPLRDVVVFPQMVTPLFVSRPKSIAALEQALLRDDRLVVLVAQKDPETEDPKIDDLYQIGTVAEVMQMLKLPDGAVKVLVEGNLRVKLFEINDGESDLATKSSGRARSKKEKDISEGGFFTSRVTTLEENIEDDQRSRTLVRVTVEKF